MGEFILAERNEIVGVLSTLDPRALVMLWPERKKEEAIEASAATETTAIALPADLWAQFLQEYHKRTGKPIDKTEVMLMNVRQVLKVLRGA